MRASTLQRPSYRDPESDEELFGNMEQVQFKKNSTEDSDEDIDNDAMKMVDDPSTVQEAMSIEKILGRKYVSNQTSAPEELFLIKWKKFSYIHVSWEKRDKLVELDPHGKLKVKRFMLSDLPPEIKGESTQEADTENGAMTGKKARDDDQGSDNPEVVEYFNADLVEVQRIVSCQMNYSAHARAKTHLDLLDTLDYGTNSKTESANDLKYLVKWRGSPYNECSWERFEDLKNNTYEIWKFWKLQKAPRLPVKKPKFPTLSQYKKLEASPAYGVEKIEKESVLNLNMLSDSKMADTEAKSPTSDEADGGSDGLRLRDYQLEGVNWLLWNWWHRRPCILADEMGLGKTIQTVSFLHQLRFMATTKLPGPFLVIAPLSLIDQWQSEINTWSPQMNCILLHGNAEARDMTVKHEFYYHEPFVSRADAMALKKQGVYKFHVLLTTYEMAVKDVRILSKIDWQVCVIDEAHKLKNPTSKLFQTLRMIPCKHSVLLTGTPLQNKTEELWALLNFADSTRFADLSDFCSKFGDLKEAAQVAKLHDVLKPYLLRRIKEDVEKSLPPKEETIIEVALTSIQKQFYRAIYEKNTQYLFKGVKSSNQPSLMNVMMELRKCCNHPYLIRGVEDRVLADLTPAERDNDEICHKKLIDASGKLVLLQKLLPRLYSQGSKVLVFSQMVRVLNLLEDFLRHENYTFERLDGSTKSVDRKEAVEKFCNASTKTFIMLLSTKAGGLGLNLTAADTVVIFDSDWNPQNDLQAQARAHRIGQTKAVMVYRLLTRKTYEMEMFHQASMKLGLDRAVLAHARNEQEHENEESDANAASSTALTSATNLKNNISVKEIDELLKRGAYDVFREDDTEQQEFQEADIDVILQRRSHKVSYENGGTNVTSSLGNFSKASFVSADEKEDVDINDPDFWQKAIGLHEHTKTDLLEPNVESATADLLSMLVTTKRVRNQTKSFSYADDKAADEEQVKQFLKPLKSEKALQRTKQQEEIAAKKAAERALKQKKQLDEERAKNDPDRWNSFLRDRVLRALQSFGIGRWKRIMQETGKGITSCRAVQQYTQSFILQLGIFAAESEPTKTDTEFVLAAISSTKKMKDFVKAGQENPFNIPPTLSDPKFLMKLKGGVAKKTLTKLGYLRQLYGMMQETVERAYIMKGVEVDKDATIDELFSALTLEEVLEALPLGPIRPAWTRIKKWWDHRCDQHMLYGIFKYGYGRYDLIKEDESLCFKNILLIHGSCGRKKRKKVMRESLVEQEQDDDAMDDKDDMNSVDEQDEYCLEDGGVDDVTGVDMEQNTATAVKPQKSSQSLHLTSTQNVDEYVLNEDAADQEAEENEYEVDIQSSKVSKPSIPTLARSVSNLTDQSSGQKRKRVNKTNQPFDVTGSKSLAAVSSASAMKASIPDSDQSGDNDDDSENPMDQDDDPDGGNDNDGDSGDGGGNDGETELKPSTSQASLSTTATLAMPDARSLNRLFGWLVSSDMARMTQQEYHERNRARVRIHNNDSSTKLDSGKILSSDGMIADEHIASMLSSHQLVKFVDLEENLLACLNDLFDEEAIVIALKPTVRGLQTCEEFLIRNSTIPSGGAGVVTSSSTTSLGLALSNHSQESDTSSNNNNNNNKVVFPSSPSLNRDASNLPISEADRLRLSCALILFGAPIGHREITQVPIKVLTSIGCLPTAIRNLSVNLVCPDTAEFQRIAQCFKTQKLQLFSWEDIRKIANVEYSDDVLTNYYQEHWLPFCQAISQRKNLSVSQNKQLLPDPDSTVADHHYASKGLCQLFLIRQQLIRAIHFILVNHFNLLLEYLTNTVQGRNVDNMPVWWCPWTHDVAILIGILKHGYAGLPAIMDDSELPFTRPTLELHIRQTFLQGNQSIAPVGLGDISSSVAAERFVALALLQFPDPRTIDLRLARIMEDITVLLVPRGHYCHIRSSTLIFNAGMKSQLAQMLSNSTSNCAMGSSTSDAPVVRAEGLSLNGYLNATLDDRRKALQQQHPLLLRK